MNSKPPGVVLQDLLYLADMAQAELGRRLNRPLKTINEIVKGKTAITPETASQLERTFGVPAEWWLYGQANQQLSALRPRSPRRPMSDEPLLEGERMARPLRFTCARHPEAEMVRGSNRNGTHWICTAPGCETAVSFDAAQAVEPESSR